MFNKSAHYLNETLDLSKETLMRLCKGDPRRLPSFRVYDNAAWPYPAMPAKGVIHIRRSSFQAIVMQNQIPVRAGLWVSGQAQDFTIDLKAHHLQGSEDPAAPVVKADQHQAARDVAQVDAAGRRKHEVDYGTAVVESRPSQQIDPDDLERIARNPERGSVRSATVDGGGDTEGSLAMGPDD